MKVDHSNEQQNRANSVVKGISDLREALATIFKKAESEGDFDAAHQRLKRWKEHAVQFISDNVSLKEARVLEQTELGVFTTDAFMRNLGDEISLYDAVLRTLVEEIYENPSLLTKPGLSRSMDTAPSGDLANKASSGALVFIVHGRNHAVRDQIDLYLTKDLGLQTQVMQAGANAGRTLPEKFEEMAKACQFAVFILTADDALREESSGERIKRARQNVILEIGYFWGAIGRRGKVAFLVDADPEMELPSDIQGIGSIPITSDLAETKMQLSRELKAAGIVQ